MPIDPKDLDDALRMLQSHLEWKKSEGVRSLRVEPSSWKGLDPQSGKAVSELRAERSPSAPSAMIQAGSLDELAVQISKCTRCGLCKGRNRTVPGQGHPRPEILFIGEGPGKDEDEQGLAFVGRAGQLLTRMIVAMGLTRDDVFIANIVKCRPTEDGKGIKDRPPTREEMDACLPYLHRQIELLQPKAIIALGGSAVKGLFGDAMTGITRLRGQWLTYRGIDVMPTFHPSYLLRQGGENKEAFWTVWEDLAQVLRKVGKPVPERRRNSSS